MPQLLCSTLLLLRMQWGEPINAFRFQIIAGQLYVDYSGMPYVTREDGQVMWFPSQTTAPGGFSGVRIFTEGRCAEVLTGGFKGHHAACERSATSSCTMVSN